MVKETSAARLIEVELEGRKHLATLNLAPGVRVYGERLLQIEGREYRLWDPFRSKLAASLLKGLDRGVVLRAKRVLYLGVASGTTASHLSDILGPEGRLFGVEMAARIMGEFIDRVAQHRDNVIPIIEDARRPERYTSLYGRVDLIYCDIAQPDQTEIALLNCSTHLVKGGALLMAIKARSIDVAKDDREIYQREAAKLRAEGFKIEFMKELEPFDKDHAMLYALSPRL